MFSELSVIWISISVIVLCWAVVRINQKIDEAVSNYKHGNSLDPLQETQDRAPDRGQGAPYSTEL